MKVSGILILIAMSLAVFSPLTVSMSFTPESGINYIITLDVCHATDGVGSANSDLPAFFENVFSLVHLESLQCVEPRNLLVLSFDVPFQKDRPPQS